MLRRVEIGVRGIQADAALYQAVDRRSVRVIPEHPLHAEQHDRMMREHQIHLEPRRLLRNGHAAIQRDQHAPNFLRRGTDQQPHIVKIHRQLRRCYPLHRRNKVIQQHGQSSQ